MTAAEKARRNILAIEIPRDELACRIAEKVLEVKRPAGMDSEAALADLDQQRPGTARLFQRAADTAIAYYVECVNAARQPS